jgi:hypothetical protein
MNYSKGSIWRKWDLHIHSPLTILNNQYPRLGDGTPDWEAFVKKLETLDVAVVGITDYFTIEGYKKIREYKQKGRLNNIQAIFPNIEFRLNCLVSSKKDGQAQRRLNYHVIFSDDISEKDIEEHFLHDLDFFYEGNPQNKDEKRKLKLSNLQELGEKLIKEQFKGTKETPLEIGAKCAVVNHEQITDVLTGSARFKGKYLMVFPSELSNLIDWNGQDHNVRKGLLQKSDMVFSSNSKDRNWCLGRNPYMEGEKTFLEEFKTLKPCIHGSDAHVLSEVGSPCGSRGVQGHKCQEGSDDCNMLFCWVKANPTFEGLRQLLYEPSDRVAIQQKDPTPIKSNYSIESVEFNDSKINEGLSIKNTKQFLNYGLVAVTGSKGSGKTAFVDLIANCYHDRCHDSDPNSFVRRIMDQSPVLDTTLKFKGGTTFSKGLREDKFFKDSEIVYIAQGELEKHIGNDSDLESFVRELIFESPKVKDTVKSFEFSELTQRVDELASGISQVNDSIVKLEGRTSDKQQVQHDSDRRQREADLNDVKMRIAELEKNQSKDSVAAAKKIQEELVALRVKKENLVNLKELLERAISFVDTDVLEFNRDIPRINSLLQSAGIDKTFEEIVYKQRAQIEEALKEVKSAIPSVIKGIEQAQKASESRESSIRDHARLLDKKREVEKEIEKENTKAKQLGIDKGNLLEERKKRKELMNSFLNTIILQQNKYNEIIEIFAEEQTNVLAELAFGTEINFGEATFFNVAGDIIDKRKVQIDREGGKSIFEKLMSIIESLQQGKEDAIKNYIEEIERLDVTYREKMKVSKTVSLKNYCDFLYGNYLKVTPTIKYKNTRLSKLSLGQKATVLIKIYLAQGDRPIIIDSHDDHLDNEFIMEELVKAIRQAKNHRQVILASNNGNVVVNSDAEQVIIANRDGNGQISYMSGALENQKIRDRAVEVLEGGAMAFKQRQNKYRLVG